MTYNLGQNMAVMSVYVLGNLGIQAICRLPRHSADSQIAQVIWRLPGQSAIAVIAYSLCELGIISGAQRFCCIHFTRSFLFCFEHFLLVGWSTGNI